MSCEHVVACIIARTNSTRLPRKVLRSICGTSMIVHLIRRIQTAEEVDEVYLCMSVHPDDAVLLDLAEQCGAKGYAGSELNIIDRMLEVADITGADTLIRITGDNALTDPVYIDRMVRHHSATGAEYTRTLNLPLGVTAEVMATSALRRCYDIMDDPNNSQYLMIYMFDPDNFECEVLFADSEVSRPSYSLTVDTAEEFARMERIFDALYTDERPVFPLQEVITFLDEHAEEFTVSPTPYVKRPGGRVISLEQARKEMEERVAKVLKRSAKRRTTRD